MLERKGKFSQEIDGNDLHAFPKIKAKEVNLQNQEVININKNVHSFDEDHIVKSNNHELVIIEQDSLNEFPKLNWKRMGNYEITHDKRYGVGEYGVAVRNTPAEKEKVDMSIKEFGFNMVNSDKISLDRLPKDLRHEEFSFVLNAYIYIYILIECFVHFS